MKKRAICIAFICMQFYSWAQNTLLSENFDASGSLPSGWTQQFVTNSYNWVINTGAVGGSVTTANSGSNNLMFQESDYNNSTTKIITPKIDFTGNTDNPTLKFHHAQEDWSGDQGELRVYYTTDTTGGGTWTLLQSYTASVSSWTQRTISLSGVGASYYIAFEGLTNYDYGVVIDDVLVTGGTANPPSAFTISNATERGCIGDITISWNDPGDADSFDVYYCEGGACDPALGLSNIGVSSPYNLTGLNKGSEYQIKIKANNGGGSTWSSNTNTTYTWTDYTWSGTVSTDYEASGNWCGGIVPGGTDHAIIPDENYTTYDPHYGAIAYNILELTIDENATFYYDNDSLDGNSYYYDIDSVLTLNGTFNHTGEAYVHFHEEDARLKGTGNCLNCKFEIDNYIGNAKANVILDNDFKVYKWYLKDNTTSIDLNGYTLSTYDILMEGASGTVNFGSGTLQFEGAPSNLTLNGGSLNFQTGTFYYGAGINWTAVNQTVSSDFTYYNLKVRTQSSNTVTFGSGSTVNVNNNCEIVNGETVSLSNNLSVTGNLLLTDGRISLGNRDLNILPNGAITVYSSDDYIITNGTGALKQQALGSAGRSGEVVFPVATTNLVYAPAFITNGGTVDTYGVIVEDQQLEDGTSGSAITTFNVDLAWQIDEFTAGGSDVTLKLSWPVGQENTSFDRTESFIQHYDGAWNQMATNSAATSLGSLWQQSVSGLTDFSPYGVGSDNAVLPVELIMTELNCDNGAEIEWVVTGEIDVDFYELINLTSEESIQIARKLEEEGVIKRYATSVLGNGTYQLNEVNFDGERTYLDLFVVECLKEDVAPVIIQNGESLTLFNTIGYKEIKIYDMQGQLIFVNSLQEKINLSLPIGAYFVTLTGENKQFNTKLLWQSIY